MGRGAEHLDGLVAPLVYLVSLVGLVDLVCLVCLVYPVSLVQPKNQTDQTDETDKTDQTNKTDTLERLGDFFSILLTVTGIYAGTDTTTCAERYEIPRVELPPVTVGRDR